MMVGDESVRRSALDGRSRMSLVAKLRRAESLRANRRNGGGARAGTPATLARLDDRPMNPITLSWEDWRAVIAVLHERGLPYELEDADHIERLLECHAADEPLGTLHLTDDVYLRSSNGARLALGIPLPRMER